MQNLENLKTPFKILKKSHREKIEQIFGFFLFFLAVFTFMLINRWISTYGVQQQMHLFSVIKTLPKQFIHPVWAILYLQLSFSLWFLWRIFSIQNLKLELGIFFIQMILLVIWHVLFFIFKLPLLSLIAILFISFLSFLCFYSFWKKDQMAGIFFLPYLGWIFLLTSLNMLLSM